MSKLWSIFITPSIDFTFEVSCGGDTVFTYSDPVGGSGTGYSYSSPLTAYDSLMDLQTAIDSETITMVSGTSASDDIPTGTAGIKWVLVTDSLGNKGIKSVVFDCTII